MTDLFQPCPFDRSGPEGQLQLDRLPCTWAKCRPVFRPMCTALNTTPTLVVLYSIVKESCMFLYQTGLYEENTTKINLMKKKMAFFSSCMSNLNYKGSRRNPIFICFPSDRSVSPGWLEDRQRSGMFSRGQCFRHRNCYKVGTKA